MHNIIYLLIMLIAMAVKLNSPSNSKSQDHSPRATQQEKSTPSIQTLMPGNVKPCIEAKNCSTITR